MNNNNKKIFGEVKSADVTFLVENSVDMLEQSTEFVKRYTQESGPPLIAEHGLSILIDIKDTNKKIIFDAGITNIALIENMKRMNIDAKSINIIVLSHGHPDHVGAMTGLIRKIIGPPVPRNWGKEVSTKKIDSWIQSHRVPMVTHPAAFRERWKIFPSGNKYGPMITPRKEYEAAGSEIILSEEPYKLDEGCWSTGFVPRNTFEKSGTPEIFAYRENGKFKRDFVDDDEAIILNIKDKGLVIIAGCAHSGILNTIYYAQKISGVDKIYAVVGGFHLISSTKEEIKETVKQIKDLNPEVISPSHCTGYEAIREFSNEIPDKFINNLVGTSFVF